MNARQITRWSLALGLLIVISAAGLYAYWLNPGTKSTPGEFNAERAYQDLVAQVELGPRIPESPGQAAFLRWAQANLEASGWEVQIQQVEFGGRFIQNIIARSGDLEPGGEWIILATHYDTRAFADRDPVAENRTLPVPGANDGASGVAVLLEIARVRPETEQNIWIVLFDAEDNGDIGGQEWMLGSQAFVESLPTLAPAAPHAVVVIDMIADAELDIHMERSSDPGLTAEIWMTAQELGHGDAFIPVPKYHMLDDHTPFLRAGIPAVLLIDFDYPFWHTVSDTPDKVSAESLQVVGETLLSWLDQRSREN